MPDIEVDLKVKGEALKDFIEGILLRQSFIPTSIVFRGPDGQEFRIEDSTLIAEVGNADVRQTQELVRNTLREDVKLALKTIPSEEVWEVIRESAPEFFATIEAYSGKHPDELEGTAELPSEEELASLESSDTMETPGEVELPPEAQALLDEVGEADDKIGAPLTLVANDGEPVERPYEPVIADVSKEPVKMVPKFPPEMPMNKRSMALKLLGGLTDMQKEAMEQDGVDVDEQVAWAKSFLVPKNARG